MADQLETQLAEELAKVDLREGAPISTPAKPMPSVRPFRVKELPKDEPRPERGSDQLALAVKGLLQIEDEFLKLATELVGDLDIVPADHEGKPSESGAVLPSAA